MYLFFLHFSLIFVLILNDYDPESGYKYFADPMYPDPDPNLKITFLKTF